MSSKVQNKKHCDVKGCKRKAEYFTPSFKMCFIHWQDLVREAVSFVRKMSQK